MHRWEKYDGRYVKEEYMVRTRDKVIHGPCWPNAGVFHLLDGHSGEVIDGEDVEEVLRLGIIA